MRPNFLRLVLSVASAAILFISVNGQNPEGCPVTSVNGPDRVIDIGKIARYQVNIGPSGRDLALTFKWSLSAGTIKEGQGTKQIEVLQPGNCMTAAVEVGGLPPSCPFAFSETTCVDGPPLSEMLFEMSGTLNKSALISIKKALEQFQVDKYARAYVVVYTRRESDFFRRQHAVQKLFGSEPNRLIFLHSRSQRDRMAIWSVPAGATPPVP